MKCNICGCNVADRHRDFWIATGKHPDYITCIEALKARVAELEAAIKEAIAIAQTTDRCPNVERVLKVVMEDKPTEQIAHYEFSDKNATISAIISECKRQGIGLNPQIAYILATVEHETNGTFKPVVEAYWKSEKWRQKHFRYAPYYGRGFVQITWAENYEKFSKILGVDIVDDPNDPNDNDDPNRALDPNIALFILVYGFKHGSFTGKKITDYINEDKMDFCHARKCVNGMDRATEIAALAVKHLRRLEAK